MKPEALPGRNGAHNCPLERDPVVRAKFDETVKHIRVFARSLVAWSEKLPAHEREKELHAISESSRVVFQKWTLEILYTLGVSKVLRFGALKGSLPGISSRTLSLKLDELERLGFVNRKLYDERPIRVEYSLTEKGMILASLTTPLVGFLHRELDATHASASPIEAAPTRSPRAPLGAEEASPPPAPVPATTY